MCLLASVSASCQLCFFFNDTATTEIYTLSLHDALPILWRMDISTVTGQPKTRDSRPSATRDRKSTRLNSSRVERSYAVFCLKKKKEGSTNFDFQCDAGVRQLWTRAGCAR